MVVQFDVIIPARYQSSRLPGKPLADIAGRPMILRVVDGVRRSRAARIFVATDDKRIEAVCVGEGVDVCFTSDQHRTGTDRIMEAIDQLALEPKRIVVNVQGDLPLIDPIAVDAVAQLLLEDEGSNVSTVAYRLAKKKQFLSPHTVKVVRDCYRKALYFSRSPIPYAKNIMESTAERLPEDFLAYGHVGIYGYRCSFLRETHRMSSVPPMEVYENLEQLRFLYHGYSIVVGEIPDIFLPEVNTPEDVEQVAQYLRTRIMSNTR